MNEPIEAALLRGGPAATQPLVVVPPAPPEPSALEELRSRMGGLREKGALREAVDEVLAGRLDPYAAADRVVADLS